MISCYSYSDIEAVVGMENACHGLYASSENRNKRQTAGGKRRLIETPLTTTYQKPMFIFTSFAADQYLTFFFSFFLFQKDFQSDDWTGFITHQKSVIRIRSIILLNCEKFHDAVDMNHTQSLNDWNFFFLQLSRVMKSVVKCRPILDYNIIPVNNRRLSMCRI